MASLDPQRRCKAVRSAILAIAWLLVFSAITAAHTTAVYFNKYFLSYIHQNLVAEKANSTFE